MLKKILLSGVIFVMLMTFAGCGEKKTLHCDNCNGEVLADADSNMDESWIIYCENCEKELFPDGIVPVE